MATAAAPAQIDEGEIEGNRLALIVDGPAHWEALMALIAGARESVKLYYYIFEGDRSGTAVREALLDAINRGVRVSLIVDGFGSSDTGLSFFAPLEEAGADCCRFMPRFGRRYLLRNHQKMAIADGARAIIGGFNIADDYFEPTAEGGWHDLGLHIEGRAVHWLSRYFDALLLWAHLPRPSLRRLRKLLRAMQPHPAGKLHWLLGGPTRRLSPWARAVKRDLDHAHQADMVQAYFSPGRSMLKRLKRVVKRGGRTRIVTAAKSDNGATIGAARFLYGGLLRRKVELWEYRPARLHVKLIVIDDVTYIGSANFDMRSLFLNLELMLRIQDAGFATLMRGFISECAQDSEAITPAVHRARRTPLRLLKGWLSYLLVGVLDYKITRRLNLPG